jgi:anhydro-N-acetylmuramic acid kinase
VARFLAENDIAAADIAVIGFHGQTVLHRPDRKLTVQIGDGAALARAAGIGVVYDLRACDVEQGGQGAPLVPVYHRALVQRLGIRDPVAVVNIGGVANITYVDGDTLIACDVGPGNALLDDFMLARTGSPIDRGGAAAACGRPDEGWIAEALKRPFFARPAPKSLDRNDFADLSADGMSVEDGAATLTAFTAAAIAASAERLPKPPAGWIVAGGGARNPTLLAMLATRLAPSPVTVASDHGWSADAMEAQAFAFLAVRSMRALPLTYPSTTGVPRPTAGGELVHPQL